jgi:ATP-dependent Lon protease
MNVFAVEPPSPDAARQIARNLYQNIRHEHGWGVRFAPEPQDDVLDRLCELAPRDMRRALMTGFGNARLDHRDHIATVDLPKAGTKKGHLGFLQ